MLFLYSMICFGFNAERIGFGFNPVSVEFDFSPMGLNFGFPMGLNIGFRPVYHLVPYALYLYLILRSHRRVT